MVMEGEVLAGVLGWEAGRGWMSGGDGGVEEGTEGGGGGFGMGDENDVGEAVVRMWLGWVLGG